MSEAPRLRRSALYVPGSNARAMEKARGLDVDVVILDLEDAVAPSAKIDARRNVVEAVRARAFAPKETVVRLNALETPEGAADLEALAAAGADALLTPKVSSPDDIANLCAALDALDAQRGAAIWAMIETARAVTRLDAIASLGARRRLAALVLGLNDLTLEVGWRLDAARTPVQGVLTSVVLAARAHGLIALDAVCNDARDLERFEAEARQARDFGFDGKSLIHPDQIAPCHAAFAPSPSEIAWAEKVVAAFRDPESLRSGVLLVDGQMVERLHLDGARRLLAAAERR